LCASFCWTYTCQFQPHKAVVYGRLLYS
jgi:hypothetical protein